MTGEVHWLPLLVVLGATIPVLLALLRNRREERKFKVELHHVRCRARGNQLAQCTLVRDAKTGAPIGIRDCTAWAGQEGSHCEKSCLPLFVEGPSDVQRA